MVLSSRRRERSSPLYQHGNSELCAGLQWECLPSTKVSGGWEGSTSDLWLSLGSKKPCVCFGIWVAVTVSRGWPASVGSLL